LHGRSHAEDGAMRSRTAFTLIEVLLAVFIIGLGSIGLFALFAGVATQQSRASELSRSVAQAQGLLGTLEGRVGALTDWQNNAGVPLQDPVFRTPIVRGVWYPAFSYYRQNAPALTINPNGRQFVNNGR